MSWRPDWSIIRSLFRFGLPAGVQGVAMNLAGVMLLRFIGSLEHSAEAQAAYAVGYTELFSLITWTSVGLMGAAGAVAGQNLGAGHPDRTMRAVSIAARIGLSLPADRQRDVPSDSRAAALDLRPEGSDRREHRQGIPSIPEHLRVLHHGRAHVHRGLQGTGDTRSPLYITLVSQIVVPIGLCATLQATGHLSTSGVWTAILLGHLTRCVLTVTRFKQAKWRTIVVE